MFTRLPRSLSLALLTSLLVCPAFACSDLGTHKLAIEGSEAVTAGIAMTSTDGWDISFSSFVVVVHDPGLIERVNNDPTYVREPGVTVWNVVDTPAEDDALSRLIRASRYDGAQFRIAPASASEYEALSGNVGDDVLDTAVDDDWSIHVVGEATTGTETIAFDWTFDTNTFYRCEFEDDEIVELGADGDETTVIEILGEALFRSEADDASAPLTFQPIADADADSDGTVTADELDAAGVLDRVVELTHELGGVRGAGACPEFEAAAEE